MSEPRASIESPGAGNDKVHPWDWCGDKAPGDNGMYDVLCALPFAHDGDHEAEGAQWRR